MTPAQWSALIAVCLLGAVSPGPSLAIVIKNTVEGGRGQGAATAIAHGFGIGLYALIVVAGLGVLIATVPVVFQGLKYAGALFLLYLAYKAFRTPPLSDAQSVAPSARRGALEGFLVAFLNPKIAVFFIALFSQFLSTDQPLYEKVGMVAITAGVDALWYLLVAMGVSRQRILGALRTHYRLVNRIFGVILVVVALAVLWQ